MTRHLDDLPYPPTAGLSPQERAYLAYELNTVAIAARERAGVLYAGGQGRAAWAITELNELAAAIQQRARAYKQGR